MPGEHRVCLDTFNYASTMFFCVLNKGHRGDHKDKGYKEGQSWQMLWSQEQSGLKVESENKE